MAVKSKEWFYTKCLEEVRGHSRLDHLAWDILMKGIGGKDSTRGHVTQAVGVAQTFLTAKPAMRAIIQASDPTLPFDVRRNPAVQKELRKWVGTKSTTIGRKSFGFSFATFRAITTSTMGGHLVGGGGGNDEFKRVLRLMAEFL